MSQEDVNEQVDRIEFHRPGSGRWFGPVRLYALAKQHLKFTADEGSCSYVFGDDETAAIEFDAIAADYQAAFEALASVGAGNVVATGDPGSIVLTFNPSIESPDLIQQGSWNSLKLADVEATPTFFVSSERQAVELFTPAQGDIILDAFGVVVVPFDGSNEPCVFLADDGSGNENWYSEIIQVKNADDVGDNFTGNGQTQNSRSAFGQGINVSTLGLLPTLCKNSVPVFAIIANIDADATDQGVADIYYCVASPAPRPA